MAELVDPGVLPPSTRRPTLAHLAEGFLRWAEAHGWRPLTIVSYRDALELFLTFCQRHDLTYPEQMSVLVCDGYFVWLRDRGASTRTISHRRAVLISFWRWLEHEGLAPTNVPQKTYPIKLPKRIPVWLEPHQIKRFLAALAALPDLAGKRDHAIVATFFYAGLRVSELVRLRVEDIDITAARIRVNGGKGGKDRVGYMPPPLQTILARYLADVRPHFVGAGSWLFTRSDSYTRRRAGLPLLERSVFGLIRRLARTHLGVRLSPHKLRHTAASYLLHYGAQLETIQHMLGHADVRTTMVYLHVPQQRQEEELARIFSAEAPPRPSATSPVSDARPNTRRRVKVSARVPVVAGGLGGYARAEGQRMR